MTRDVSDFGVYVECQSPVSIPLFRLVQFQLERDSRPGEQLPAALRNGGRILSAVYRISPPKSSGQQGLALRLMIEPKSRALQVSASRATA